MELQLKGELEGDATPNNWKQINGKEGLPGSWELAARRKAEPVPAFPWKQVRELAGTCK